MKRLLCLAFIGFTISSINAQVGINTTSPDENSMLDVRSDDKGILIPRLTTANRVAMADVQGMLVYDSTLNQFFYNDGGQWVAFLTAASSIQSGTLDLGATDTSMSNTWQYYTITFPTAFAATPIITISLREGTGIDNNGSDSITQIKIANASATGFTVGVRETANTTDHFVNWIATPQS